MQFLTAGDNPLCNIPIENILAVEKLEEESFKMKNVGNLSQLLKTLILLENSLYTYTKLFYTHVRCH